MSKKCAILKRVQIKFKQRGVSMSNRQTTYNFNAGPSALPTVVLERAQQQLTNYENHGMSIMEMSHRGAVYEEVHNAAIDRMRRLFNIPENYEVLFLQGGASLQFAMIPMNFLNEGEKAGYVTSGSWSEKALKESEKALNKKESSLKKVNIEK